jgi:hypothetical protein
MVTLSYDKRWLGAMWDFEDSDYRESFFHGTTNIPTNKVIQLENKEIEYENCLYFYELYRDGKRWKPIWVRKYKDGYQVLDGHHRLDTTKKLGLPTIEAYIVPSELVKIQKEWNDSDYKKVLKRYKIQII